MRVLWFRDYKTPPRLDGFGELGFRPEFLWATDLATARAVMDEQLPDALLCDPLNSEWVECCQEGISRGIVPMKVVVFIHDPSDQNRSVMRQLECCWARHFAQVVSILGDEAQKEAALVLRRKLRI